jgi:hypothetical protein
MKAISEENEELPLFKIPLDPKTLQRIRACKHEGFPLCLRSSFVNVFEDYDEGQFLEIAKKEESAVVPKGEKPDDIWDLYLRLLSGLSKQVGNNVVAKVESQVLKEIETLECTECPIYEVELRRNRSRVMEKHC